MTEFVFFVEQMPQVSTDLHLTLEQVMLSYDHSLVKKASDLRMKLVFCTHPDFQN